MGFVNGKLTRAQRIVLYGPEGIGKSCFAAMFPNPVFLDVEDGTGELDVKRWDRPLSWTMLLKSLDELSALPGISTLVLDTADACELLAKTNVCANAGLSGIEDFGYGRGYTYLAEEFGKLLNKLTQIKDKGFNIVILAHSTIRKFEQPDETGSYDRWELTLEKKVTPLVKAWADMVLFANYETYVVEDEKTKKKKGVGGNRVMHTSHHPCWDAKNRHDLPPKLSFDFDEIAHCIPIIAGAAGAPVDQLPNQPTVPDDQLPETSSDLPKNEPVDTIPNNSVMDQLKQLMQADNISVKGIQGAVARRGYFPLDTPISNYNDTFIQGVLINKWTAVKKNIENYNINMKKGA